MNHLDAFRDITTFIFDVDGVLTDGTVFIEEDGRLLRTMHVRDGFAMRTAVNKGYRLAIISAGKSDGVKVRLEALGIEDVLMRQEDKAAAFDGLVAKYDINPDQTLYMGDDLPDYKVMRKVGMPACPSDAAQEILELARYISPVPGGRGCVRDVIEKVLRLRGDWPVQTD
jgi:3-deoxy-D-manno-octulosonate 8-phosphate phosphatase (KDO 8-P phosphatase)